MGQADSDNRIGLIKVEVQPQDPNYLQDQFDCVKAAIRPDWQLSSEDMQQAERLIRACLAALEHEFVDLDAFPRAPGVRMPWVEALDEAFVKAKILNMTRKIALIGSFKMARAHLSR